MPWIENKHDRVLKLPAGVRLEKGPNLVDDKRWKKAKNHPITQTLMGRKLFAPCVPPKNADEIKAKMKSDAERYAKDKKARIEKLAAAAKSKYDAKAKAKADGKPSKPKK